MVAEIHGKNTCSVHGIGKKEKNFMLGFAVEVTAPVHSECLVKTEKAWHLGVEVRERKRVPTDHNTLPQKVSSLYQQGVPCNEWRPAGGYRWRMVIQIQKEAWTEKQKLLERLHLLMKKLCPHCQWSWRNGLAFGAILPFRHLPGVLEHIPCR